MQYKYGYAPLVLDENVILNPSEFCFVQYMPIKMAGSGDVRVPKNLSWINDIVRRIGFSSDDYVYATVKNYFVSGGCAGNRPGWHSDGFMTDDINYIWYNENPTDFCVQEFIIDQDCDKSLQQMESQALDINIVNYPCNTLIRLDQSVIHRVAVSKIGCVRAFVKISVSKNKYNLAGNAHNYLFDYEWEMVERSKARNHPFK